MQGSLNVRKKASTDSKVVGKMTDKDACEIVSVKGDWAKITSGKVEGYVKTEYLLTGGIAHAIDNLSKELDLEELDAYEKPEITSDHEGLQALADKPDCPLIGADGNIFNLLGIASRTLREHGLKEQAKEMSDRVFVSGSYGEALCIIGEYVNITDSKLEHKNSLRQQLKATKPADPVKKQQTSKQQER